ncbi:MAG: uracil-DNA glycosylase family protein [Pseudomonadota bacterium]
MSFADLLAEVRACRHCEQSLPHAPRPVLQAGVSARLAIIGQAPGARVHQSGRPFTDPSGDRLRDWMGVGPDVFYDPNRLAIIPMGFCFPGYDAKGADLPPRKECAPLWHERLFRHLPNLSCILLVGGYAHRRYLPKPEKGPRLNVTEAARAWRSAPAPFFPLPHPSWRNNHWLKTNPWFEAEALPVLRKRVTAAIVQP